MVLCGGIKMKIKGFNKDLQCRGTPNNEVGERGVNYEIEKTKIVSCVNGFVTSGFSFDCVLT